MIGELAPFIANLTIVGHLPGVLACLDGYMNIALEQTEEYVNGQLKNKYGDAFIRGNNGQTITFAIIVEIDDNYNYLSLTVLYISTQKRRL